MAVSAARLPGTGNALKEGKGSEEWTESRNDGRANVKQKQDRQVVLATNADTRQERKSLSHAFSFGNRGISELIRLI